MKLFSFCLVLPCIINALPTPVGTSPSASSVSIPKSATAIGSSAASESLTLDDQKLVQSLMQDKKTISPRKPHKFSMSDFEAIVAAPLILTGIWYHRTILENLFWYMTHHPERWFKKV